MDNIEEINTTKKPIVIIDKSLDFFNDKVLFPEKLEKANEMLKKVGLPIIEGQLTNQSESTIKQCTS